MVALLEEKINKNWEAFNKYESELRKALKKELKAETIESEKLKAAYTKLADFYWDRARDGDVVNAYLILTEIKKQVKADSIIQDLDNKLQYAQRQVELWFGDKAKQEIERVAVLFPEKYEFLNIDLQNLSNFVKMNNLANDHELSTAISMGSLSKEKDDSVKLSILIEVREEVKSGLQVCHGVLNKVRCKEQEYQLFEQLALSYLIFEDHHNYPKVIGIYEYMKKLNPNMQEELEERIQNIEAKFVRQIIGSFPDTLLGVDEYILRLASYRNRIKEELKKVGHTDMEHLYLKTNEFFIGENGLVKGLINDCMEELGGLPKTNDKAVKYSIFGMGSMALGTMTPWSDLEFGILIQDGLEKKDSERIKKFFRNLTFLLHIKVIRFGESPLRMLGIKELNDFTKRDITNAETNWFFDDLTKSGFSFDGPHSHACKTPLGRKRFEGHEDFELIGTVEDLCEFQDEKWWKSDPHLVQALNHIILIVGDNELLVSYIKKLGCYKEISKERAFKILKEDAEKLNPVSELVKADREGTILNVKKEIYRFTDRILLAIGDCLGIGNMTNWQLLRQLATEGKLTAGGAKDLKLALGIATELRLRTYANNSGQREDMSALCRYETSIKELQDNELVESVFYLQNLEPLYKYYYVVMSLSSALEKVKENIELKEIVGISAHFYSDTPTAKGYVYKRFLQYYKAIEEFERVEERGLVDNNTLSNLYQIVGRYQDALEGFSKVLKETDKKDYAVIAGTLNNIGNTYESLGKYQEALRYHQESLDMNRRIYKGDHASIAACLNNIGNVCQILGHYEQALQYYRESLKMRKIIYKGDHADIAACLNNIGNVCQILGHYEQALQHHQRESLEMRKKIYKGDHPDITGSLNNLGNIYQRLEKYQKALQYQKESLEMKERIYKGDHASIAACLNNIGNTYESLGKYQEALRYHQESLDMSRRIYKGDHASIAACLNNIGNTYESLGKYQEALRYHQESLDMRRRIYKGDHADIAMSLYSLAFLNYNLSAYPEALLYAEKAAIMFRKCLPSDHPNTIISTSLFIECELRTTKLAMLLLNAGQVDKAIECQVILIQTPENLHNLAYMYHVKALTEQGERIITEYLDKANTTFEEAISYQNAPASVYVEYAMLLLKHHKQENSEECKKIIQLLKQTIDKQDESILSYGQGEKITTIWALRKFLDQNIGVTIKPFVLANYLLCKVYHMYGKVEKAQERLDALTAISLSLEGTDDYAIAKYLLEDAEKTKEANPDLNRLINAMPTTHLDAGLATTSISNVMQFDTAISMSSINLSATNQTWEQSSFLGR
ncbi:MAG: hypothetical protein K0R73_810 [Candidatus Midichloriaceae bacterium]|nr:hypothetical protein [Candidatus Midichloriaceae bacterium]